MPTLLEYLTTPNPEINRSYLPMGPNTLPSGPYAVEGVRPWEDFTFETALKCYEDVLRTQISAADLIRPPPIARHHLTPTGEPSVEAILLKHNHTIVDHALQLAQARLQGRGLCLPISWSWGSLSAPGFDSRSCPDWAGTIHAGAPPYASRVPGETKQSMKWKSSMHDVNDEKREYDKPLEQLLHYCYRCNTRYGYIITDAEAVFVRRTKSEEPAVPLSLTRARRTQAPPPSPAMVSFASGMSEGSSGSQNVTGTLYTDNGNPDINETPLEIAIVPWSNSGPTQMTINLGVWFIHLLATSDIFVEESYPALGAWRRERGDAGLVVYRQIGSHRTSNILPPGSTLVES
jgi:hypothetical protein